MQEHKIEGASWGGDRAALFSVGPIVWAWFNAHREDKVLSIRLPVIGAVKTVRVKHLHFLFAALFGPEPVI